MMSVSKRLAAHRAAAPVAPVIAEEPTVIPTPGDEPDEDDCPEKSKKKESPMTEEEIKAANAKAAAEATAAANQRFSTVLASEHYAGREQLAQTLLGNDGMTADAIVAALAVAPKAAAPAVVELTEEERAKAAEEAGRKEMKAALEETGNSNITAGEGKGGPADDAAKTRAASDAVWNKAYGLKPAA